MRRTVRTITGVIFAAVVLGCAFAVLYLGTSTGLTFGGSASQLAQAASKHPVYAQVGWLRNTAPWPITVQSITTNVVGASEPPTIYLERAQSGAHVSSGPLPNWALNANKPPYQLDGGALRFVGFALTPASGQVSYLTSITVHYTGPLGIHFTSTFKGTTIAAEAAGLPAGILAHDPNSDASALDSYIASLRTVLLSGSASSVAAVMGNGATTADGAALLKLQTGYVTSDSVLATSDPGDRRNQKIEFYNGDAAKNGLPPITVQWSGFHWFVVRT